ncbi:MAG: hypothetical protein AAB407_00475 [Patescibacteria group bacterium]
MSKKAAVFFLALIFVVGAAFIQTKHFFAVEGIVPNAVLAILIAYAAFAPEVLLYTASALLGASLIRFNIGFDFVAFAVFIIAFAALFTLPRLPGRRAINMVVTVIFATLGVYAISDPGFIREHFVTVLWEMVYNSVVSLGAYLILLFVETHAPQTIRSQSGRSHF